jgi:hypothetical protein
MSGLSGSSAIHYSGSACGESGQFNGYLDNVTIMSSGAHAKTPILSSKKLSANERNRFSARYAGGRIWIAGLAKEFNRDLVVEVCASNGKRILE